jgi:hypothetical protein
MYQSSTPFLIQARLAGLLYLLLVIVAPFRLIYIPNALFVSGDAAATMANIAGNATLFNLGILADLFCGVLEIFIVLALYYLFRHVNRRHAILMVLLSLPTGAINFLNVLNDGAAMMFATAPAFLSAFDQAQREALGMLFLKLHDMEVLAVGFFWGLWLLPLGMLIIRSGMLPKAIGYWLIVNGLAYFAISIAGLLYPQYSQVVGMIALPAQLGEVAFMLWILIAGAKAAPAQGESDQGIRGYCGSPSVMA